MLQKFRLTASQLFNDPNARTILIVSTLLIAVLVGGAPSDGGGA